MHRFLPLSALAVLTSLAAAPGASAASLAVPPCSVSLPGQQTVNVQGNGFAPNSFVRLAADGQSFGGLQADAAGNVAGAVAAPPFASLDRNLQTFALTGDDGAGNTATADLRVTRVTATLPDRARPARRVRYRVFGFAPGRRVYLHVRRGGRTRGTFRVGTAAAPCGTASRRMRFMPVRRFSTGTYEYWFQLTRKFDRTQPSVRLRIAITRRLR